MKVRRSSRNSAYTFIRNNYWVYLFPFFMDFSLGAFLFLAILKAVWLDTGAFKIGIIGSLWGIAYFVSSLYLSRFATNKNSLKYMLVSAAAFIFLSLFLAFSKTLPLLFIIAGLAGLVTSSFFIGFQLFMEKITGLSPGKATGIYTLAWSTGMASGFLAQGFLALLKPVVSIIPIIFVCFLIITGICFSEKIIKKTSAIKKNEDSHGHTETEILIKKNTKYTYVFIGWINIFIVSLFSGGFRFLIPKLTIEHFKFSPAQSGALLFFLLIIQGITGFYLIKLPNIWYRLRESFVVKFLLVVDSLLMILFPNILFLLLFTLIAGIYAGYSFYAGVFYSLNHKNSGRNISINESLVGVATVLGPMIYGYAIEKDYRFFFLTTTVLILVLISFETFLVKKFETKSA